MIVDGLIANYYRQESQRKNLFGVIVLITNVFFAYRFFTLFQDSSWISTGNCIALLYLFVDSFYILFQSFHYLITKRYYYSPKKIVRIICGFIDPFSVDLQLSFERTKDAFWDRQFHKLLIAYQVGSEKSYHLSIDVADPGNSQWLPPQLLNRLKSKRDFPFVLVLILATTLMCELMVLYITLFSVQTSHVYLWEMYYTSFFLLIITQWIMKILGQFSRLKQAYSRQDIYFSLFTFLMDGKTFMAVSRIPLVFQEYYEHMRAYSKTADYLVDPIDQHQLLIRLHHAKQQDFVAAIPRIPSEESASISSSHSVQARSLTQNRMKRSSKIRIFIIVISILYLLSITISAFFFNENMEYFVIFGIMVLLVSCISLVILESVKKNN